MSDIRGTDTTPKSGVFSQSSWSEILYALSTSLKCGIGFGHFGLNLGKFFLLGSEKQDVGWDYFLV